MNDSLFARLRQPEIIIAVCVLLIFMMAGCGGDSPAETGNGGSITTAGVLALPPVPEMTAAGEPLRVLATTSIIGDVVRQVGGDTIDLVVLMPPGQDPHSFQPGAADMTAAADADVIFVNGWNLEEGLVEDLENIGRQAVIAPVSAGIAPRELAAGEQGDGEHGATDPHVWQDVANVEQWVENIRQVLGAADPANAAIYDANAARYRTGLEQLDADLRASLSAIPAERRVLITNHDNLGYFAAAYDFEVVGTVIPSISTLAEPTAGAMADLVNTMREQGICTLVVETTAGTQLARTLENELSFCEDVTLISLTTDALGPTGSEAGNYTGMMRANAAALVEGLGQ